MKTQIGVISFAHGHVNAYCEAIAGMSDAQVVAAWDADAERGRTQSAKFNLQFDNRFSSIENNSVTIYGLKVGAEYRGLTRFGIGVSAVLKPIPLMYYNMTSNVNETNSMNF